MGRPGGARLGNLATYTKPTWQLYTIPTWQQEIQNFGLR